MTVRVSDKSYGYRPTDTQGNSITQFVSRTLEDSTTISVNGYLFLPPRGITQYSALYRLIQLTYSLRYVVWIIAAVCLLGAIITAVQCVRTAGLRKNEEEIHCSKFIRYTPFSILVLLFAAAVCGVMFGIVVLDELVLQGVGIYAFTYEIVFGANLIFLMLIWLLSALVKKIRIKALWSTSIIGYIKGYINRKVLPHHFLRSIRSKSSELWRNLSLWWKAGLIAGGVTLLDILFLLGFCYFSWHNEVLFVLLILLMVAEKMTLLAFSIIGIYQMQKIKLGAKRIRDGGTKEKIDTSGMFWEFRSHADTLNRIGDGIQTAVEEQLKSERFQTELITNVSHDIKTPVTSIINYIDLLSRLDLQNETAAEYLEVLTRQSGKLKRLTEDLVEASKAQSGCITPKLAPLDFGLMLTQVCGEYTDRMEQANLTPMFHLPDAPVMIEADGKMLWRVCDNLMSNIIKYALPGTRVYFDLTGGTLTIRNISREVLNTTGEELVKRFVRGDASRGQTSGSGLGLAIAMSLTELMNGTLTVQVDGDLFKVILTFQQIDPQNL